MYEILKSILQDHKEYPIFKCFGLFHILFLLIGILLIILLIIFLKKKENVIQIKTIDIIISIAFGLYIFDIFLMPLAYGEIDIEKLPFHACTITCVMAFLSRKVPFLKKYKYSIAIIGLISNFVYTIYPAGVMWHQVSVLSYRVIQTLTFHFIMTLYGVLVLVFERKEIKYQDLKRDAIVLLIFVIWAVFGNLIYCHDKVLYNWFFVMQDPFGIIPLTISKYVMPFITYTIYLFVDFLIISPFIIINKQKNR